MPCWNMREHFIPAHSMQSWKEIRVILSVETSSHCGLCVFGM